MEFEEDNVAMQNIEDEINEIFADLTKKNNLTLEELDKLFSKNVELKNKYLVKMKSKAEDLGYYFSIEEKKCRINNFSTIIMILLNLGIIITNPGLALISFITLFLFFRNISHSNKKINSRLDEINKICQTSEKRLDRFIITTENNTTFILKWQKELNAKKMTELAEDKTWQEKINKANALIEKFIEDGIYPTEVDPEIEKIAVSLLQLDLNMNYKMLEILLFYAKLKRMGQLDLENSSKTLTLKKENN